MRASGVWCHLGVHVGADAVLDRLPTEATVTGLRLRLRASEARPGTLGRRARAIPITWSRGRRTGGGHLELAPLASDRTQLLLHLAPPADALLERPARALLEQTRDRLEGRPRAIPAAPPAGTTRRRWAVAAAAALGVPIVALGLLAVASSPTAVSVDDRVARFRADPTAGDAPTGPRATPSSERPAPASHPGEDDTRGAAGGGLGEPSPGGSRAAAGGDGAPAADDRDPGAATTSVTADADDGRGADDRPAPDESATEGQSDPDDAGEARWTPAPEPGVYRYATTGGEQLSVRGSARDYPETTTITVRPDQCGFTERWDVFEERWDERDWCARSGRRSLVALTSYREFFGHGQRDELACDGDAPAATAMEPGTRWTVVCEGEDTTATSRIEVVDRPRVEVDGERLDTVHVRTETRIEGETSGRMSGERWLVPTSGLLVRERSETEVETAGPVGPVDYTEQYTLRLESTRPAR